MTPRRKPASIRAEAEAEAAAEAAAEARRAREHHAKIEARSREGRRASIRVPANAVILMQARARGNAVRATMMALAGVAIVMQTAARQFLAAKRERERRARDAAPKAKPNPLERRKSQAEVAAEVDLELLISKLNANMGRVIDLFRAWDINENGEISKAEFRKGVIATLGITPSREELAALFAFLDPDGSGTIDYRELDAKLHRREVHHHPLINPEKPPSKPASRRPSSSRPVPPLSSLPQPVVAKTVAAITPRSAREWTTPGVASAPLQGRLGSDERVVGEALRTVAAGGGSPHKNYARAPSGSVAGERTVAEEIERAMEVGRERAAVRIQATRRSQNVRQTMSVLHAVVTVMQSQFRARKALAAYANDPRRVAARNVQKRVRGKRARREHGPAVEARMSEWRRQQAAKVMQAGMRGRMGRRQTMQGIHDAQRQKDEAADVIADALRVAKNIRRTGEKVRAVNEYVVILRGRAAAAAEKDRNAIFDWRSALGGLGDWDELTDQVEAVEEIELEIARKAEAAAAAEAAADAERRASGAAARRTSVDQRRQSRSGSVLHSSDELGANFSQAERKELAARRKHDAEEARVVEQQLKMYAANEAQYAQRRAAAAAEKAAATAAATAAAAEAAAAAVTYENWKRCGVKLRYMGSSRSAGPVARRGARARRASEVRRYSPRGSRLVRRCPPRRAWRGASRRRRRLVDAAAARADGVAAAVGRRTPPSALRVRASRRATWSRSTTARPRSAPRSATRAVSEDVGPAAVGALLAGPQRPARLSTHRVRGRRARRPDAAAKLGQGGGGGGAPAQAPAAAGSVAAR